jgi:L-fuculose-phosphate aldolase
MYRNGYIDGLSGNISARLSSTEILTTPSGVAKGMMKPAQLIIVNMDGERVGDVTPETVNLRPTSELPMHLECYKKRPDINGVVHAHPPIAVALTIVGYDFQMPLIPEMIVFLGSIPTAPYSTPSSIENRDAISELICDHDCIMLTHHGSLTVAATVWDAYMKLEGLEHGAKILSEVKRLGGAKQMIPYEQLEKLLATREQMGLLRPKDREAFYQIYKHKVNL